MHRLSDQPGDYEASYIPQFVDAVSFANTKIDILRDDFRIPLLDSDIKHLRSLKTENEINAAVRAIINRYWE